MHRKFTLIELLVVIAIIGILSSILLPSLTKARLKVQESVCLSNQHQVSLAIISYIADNNEFGPVDDLDGQGLRWHESLMPAYLPPGTQAKWASDVQKCPNGLELTSSDNSTIGLNGRVSGKNQTGSLTIQRSMAAATASETCLLMDSYNKWRSTGHYNMTLDRLLTDGEPDIVARHQGKANTTFLDGSSRALSYNFLITKSSWDDPFWDVEK